MSEVDPLLRSKNFTLLRMEILRSERFRAQENHCGPVNSKWDDM